MFTPPLPPPAEATPASQTEPGICTHALAQRDRGGQPSVSRIKLLSLLRPRTRFGASSRSRPMEETYRWVYDQVKARTEGRPFVGGTDHPSGITR